MKPLVHILLILASGAGLFFSINLSNKLTAVQEERQKTAEETRKVTVDKDATETNLAKEKTSLQKVSDDKDADTQAVATLKSTGASLQRDAAAQDEQIAKYEKELSVFNNSANKPSGLEGIEGLTIENLPDKLKEIGIKKGELESRVNELATLIEAGGKKRDTQKDEIAHLQEAKAKRDTRISRNSVESVITAVNQEWGFVMVGAGLNTGFTPQTKLLVMRDGYLIGKIKPTSVEANQTLADIDFDSLAPGVRIQPGDRVILAEPAAN